MSALKSVDQSIEGNNNMAMFAQDIPSKWTTNYIDSGQASTSFIKCVHENGDLQMIEELWTLIKEFMIMSDEQMRFCRRVSASQKCVVVRDGVIVPCLYFTNIFNRRALEKLYLGDNQITDITALSNALATNTTLKALVLNDNQITAEDKEIIRKAWNDRGDLDL